MKFTISFKDPDVVHDAVREAVEREVNAIESLDADEKEDLIETRSEKINDKLDKWIKYGEYVSIEFDTEAGTATVQPAK